MSLRQRESHRHWIIFRFRTSKPKVGGDAKIEEYLDKKGVSWQFHPGVDPDQFDADKSLRNQAASRRSTRSGCPSTPRH